MQIGYSQAGTTHPAGNGNKDGGIESLAESGEQRAESVEGLGG